MTGTYTSSRSVGLTKDPNLNGLLSGEAWGTGSGVGNAITYAFPFTHGAYRYDDLGSARYARISADQQKEARFFLDDSSGGAFSVEGFTLLSVAQGTDSTATIRMGSSTATDFSAYAYYPGGASQSGDILFSSAYAGSEEDYRTPSPGNYAWHTLAHELGHALGLKHGHAAEEGRPALPVSVDSPEFTLMTYKSFVGESGAGYLYGHWDAPQTFMMLDIAALQELYGADYGALSGNTTYRWTPDSGATVIDGEASLSPGGNRIFATLWDGGGIDTYDLTAYGTNLSIDLGAGKFSVFSTAQRANLGGGPNDGLARGNIFNALLYKNNVASLIENARGGSGNDVMVGNEVANTLWGNAGTDNLQGLSGNDTLVGGAGGDRLDGGTGSDTAAYDDAKAGVTASLASASVNTGFAAGDTYVSIENVFGSLFNDVLIGNAAANILSGGSGNDRLVGGNGGDTLSGGAGNDTASYEDATAGVTANLTKSSTNTGFAAGDTYSSIEHLTGSAFDDTLSGDTRNNTLSGGAGDDWLWGGAGNDTLGGGAGNDTLDGDAGADILNGGAGADRFRFRDWEDSRASDSLRDVITDFRARDGDRIDLAGIDANARVKGDQAFSFIGSSSFTGKAGELRFEKLSSDTFIYADVDGDGRADFVLQLDDAVTMDRGMFIL